MNLVWGGFKDGHFFKEDGSDIVLTSNQEHEGGRSGLNYLEKIGVCKVVVVDIPLDKNITAETILRAFREKFQENPKRIKAILISHVSCISGVRNPIRELADLAHNNNALLIIDGAQGIGGLFVSVRSLNCDVYTASCQKWSLGPTSSGLLFVRKEVKRGMKVMEWNCGGSEGEDGVASFGSSFYTHR